MIFYRASRAFLVFVSCNRNIQNVSMPLVSASIPMTISMFTPMSISIYPNIDVVRRQTAADTKSGRF